MNRRTGRDHSRDDDRPSTPARMPVQAQFSMNALLALAKFLATTGDTEALERVTAEIFERWSSETALDN